MQLFNTPSYFGTLFGVELEIEAAGLYEVQEIWNPDTEEYDIDVPRIPKGWELREEHSICGPEVVFSQPSSFDSSCALILALFKDVARQGYCPSRTPRGSMHVHVNVSDLSYEGLKNFVMACAWAEPLLIEIAGAGRKGNLFALPYSQCPLGWQGVIDTLRDKTLKLNSLDTHYMGINFRQIIQHGSVEFRMGPSMRTASEAIDWLSLIHMVATAGREETVSASEAPGFFEAMLQSVPSHVRNRVSAQAQTQAAEIWMKIGAPALPVRLVEAPIQQPEMLAVNHIWSFEEYSQAVTAGTHVGIVDSPIPSPTPQF